MSLVFLLLVSSVPDLSINDVRKALQFQYEQKVQSLMHQNAELRHQLDLKQSEISECHQKPDHLTQKTKKKNDKTIIQENEGIFSSKRKSHIKMKVEDLYRTALAQVDKEDWDDALIQFEQVVRHFPHSGWADNSIYWMGSIFLYKNEKELARTEFLRLLKKYPRSDRAPLAKRQLKRLESFQKPDLH